jgi:hypothetical protein
MEYEIRGARGTSRRDENAYINVVGKPERKDHSEDLPVDGMI